MASSLQTRGEKTMLRKKAFDRFDMIAVGEHWGETSLTEGARPGRSLLGIAFELARGDSPSNQAAPQGARDLEEYLGKGD